MISEDGLNKVMLSIRILRDFHLKSLSFPEDEARFVCTCVNSILPTKFKDYSIMQVLPLARVNRGS